MPDSALKVIRADAMNWWWYHQLRERGQVKEALKQERRSIRNTVEDLRRTKRNGGWLLIKPCGGWVLHLAEGTTCIATGGHVAIPTIAARVGITTVDFRGCDENIIFSVWMWDANPWRPEAPIQNGSWATYQRVPLWWYLDRCADVGATIHNYPNPKR
jgi:hypothetical protein